MALNYLHQKNIVHRNIRLDDVLMKNTSKDDLTLKITGSGFAKLFNPKLNLTEAHGASIYMAPELITRKEFGTKFDIWSAGVLFHLFLVGYPPFVAKSL